PFGIGRHDGVHGGKIAGGDGRYELVAIGLEKLLHALDRVAVIVEQMADAFQEVDVFRPVIAAAASPLHRLNLRKPRLPETQDMLWEIEVFGDLADGSKGVRALFHIDLQQAGVQAMPADAPALSPRQYEKNTNRSLFQRSMRRNSRMHTGFRGKDGSGNRDGRLLFLLAGHVSPQDSLLENIRRLERHDPAGGNRNLL